LQAQCLGQVTAIAIDVDGDYIPDVTLSSSYTVTTFTNSYNSRKYYNRINNYKIKGTNDISVLLDGNGKIRKVSNEVININDVAFAKIGAGKFFCQQRLGNWCLDESGFVAIKKTDELAFFLLLILILTLILNYPIED
jgi:hypothetical protein